MLRRLFLVWNKNRRDTLKSKRKHLEIESLNFPELYSPIYLSLGQSLQVRKVDRIYLGPLSLFWRQERCPPIPFPYDRWGFLGICLEKWADLHRREGAIFFKGAPSQRAYRKHSWTLHFYISSWFYDEWKCRTLPFCLWRQRRYFPAFGSCRFCPFLALSRMFRASITIMI